MKRRQNLRVTFPRTSTLRLSFSLIGGGLHLQLRGNDFQTDRFSLICQLTETFSMFLSHQDFWSSVFVKCFLYYFVSYLYCLFLSKPDWFCIWWYLIVFLLRNIDYISSVIMTSHDALWWFVFVCGVFWCPAGGAADLFISSSVIWLIHIDLNNNLTSSSSLMEWIWLIISLNKFFVSNLNLVITDVFIGWLIDDAACSSSGGGRTASSSSSLSAHQQVSSTSSSSSSFLKSIKYWSCVHLLVFISAERFDRKIDQSVNQLNNQYQTVPTNRMSHFDKNLSEINFKF